MAPVLAVTDTHALIWAATGHLHKLGRRARQMFERTEAGHAAIFVPTMVLVEVSEAVASGSVRLTLPFDRWVEHLFAHGRYHEAPLSVDIVRRSHDLFSILERGDRLIAATSAVLGHALMTRDSAIAAAAEIDRLW